MSPSRNHHQGWNTVADGFEWKTKRAAKERRAVIAERRSVREVLVQCDVCHAQATATVTGGVVTLSGLTREGERHAGCGGRLRLFDTAGAMRL